MVGHTCTNSNGQKVVKIVRLISLTLIISEVIFGQPQSTPITFNNSLKSTTKDTMGYLHIPERPNNAIEGSEFADQITGLSIIDREKAVAREILSGNVPSFSRKLRPVKIIQKLNEKSFELILFAACDYLAIGSDQDYLYIPTTPATAQHLSDAMNCLLPTKKIVDIIYANAEIKLQPKPIPPSEKMTTVPIFEQHTDSIRRQIDRVGFDRSANNLIAGHKKDIIISNEIYSTDRTYDRVVIYGWHLSDNNPIQPVYNGHNATWADYSHGVRLLSKLAFINRDSVQVEEILKDPDLSVLLSDEGVITKPYYPAASGIDWGER